MISNGLGSTRDFGTASGSQCSAGLFSLPATALGPTSGAEASNLAWPHGVKGGRSFSSIPSMCVEYGIHTPDRSRERAVAGAEEAAGVWTDADGLLACAKVPSTKTSIATNPMIGPAKRKRIFFHTK